MFFRWRHSSGSAVKPDFRARKQAIIRRDGFSCTVKSPLVVETNFNFTVSYSHYKPGGTPILQKLGREPQLQRSSNTATLEIYRLQLNITQGHTKVSTITLLIYTDLRPSHQIFRCGRVMMAKILFSKILFFNIIYFQNFIYLINCFLQKK